MKQSVPYLREKPREEGFFLLATAEKKKPSSLGAKC